MPLIQRAAIVIVLLMFMLASVLESFAETINYTYDDLLQLTKAEYGDGTTVEYVYDNLGNRLVKTTALPGAPANNPPNAVSSPTPSNSTIEVSTTPTLSWTSGGDPDTGDSVVYSVYLGTSSNDLTLVTTGPQTSYVSGQLKGLTTYYWKVTARDNHNATTDGPIWSFTTRNDPPIASFTADKTSGWAPLKVAFTDTSYDPDGTSIVSWAWDFNGDGIIDSTAQNPDFTYNSTGAYTVTLTVTDSGGATATKTMQAYITVEDDEHPGPSTVTHCVSTSSELQNALNTATTNGKNNVIRLTQGTYKVSDNNNSKFHYLIYAPFSLALKGGYTSSCTMRELNPENTVIDGEGISISRALLDIVNYYETYTINLFNIIEGVSVKNGNSSYRPGGIYLRTDSGNDIVSNNIVICNISYCSGVGIDNSTGTLVVRNNLITNKSTQQYMSALYINSYQAQTAVTNNTLIGGLSLSLYDSSTTTGLYNNIMRNNRLSSGFDLSVYNQVVGRVDAYNNIFDPAKVSGAVTNSGGNLNIDPQFVNAPAGDYSLMPTSPSIDAGSNSAPSLPTIDLIGTARIIGQAVDIGAYEYFTPAGSVVINNGNDYTTSPAVILTLSATDPGGISQMCISNTPDCSAWETYATTKNWTLPTGDGVKTVYASFKNNAGNLISSLPFKTAIVLDTTPPVITIFTFTNGSYTFNAALGNVITGTVADNTDIQSLTINGIALPILSSGNFTFNMPLVLGANTMTTVAVDLAGNQTTDVRTITLYDAEHPSPNTLFQCVTNGTELQSALTLARSNNKDNVIQLVQGTYKISENSGNRFFYTHYTYQEPHALYVKGGYTSGCSARQLNPANTYLDGEHVSGNGVISLSDNTSDGKGYTEIEGITLQNCVTTSGEACINLNSENGSVAIKNNTIRGNSSQYTYAHFGTNNGTVIVNNNLIVNNNTVTGANGGTYIYGGMYGGSIFLTNNTITNNTVTTTGVNAGVGLYATFHTSMFNNIIRNNSVLSGREIAWSGSGPVNVYNNIFDPAKVSGTFTNTGNNINADPQFVNAATGDFRLLSTSPAKDAGNNAAPYLLSTDIVGNTRVMGAAVDIGAFEFDPNNSPPAGTITINDGANYTTSTSVVLTLSATDSDGVSQMCISNTQACSAWEAYATTKNWTLSDGNGQKTVYVWYKDILGNSNQSPFTASINLNPATNSTLSVLFSGTGSGMVTSTPTALACNTNCSTQFSTGTPVTLHSAASQYSLFAGWTDGVCSGTTDCLLTLYTDSSVTAGFVYDTAHQVQVSSGSTDYFSTIQAAYNGAADTSTIKLWATNYSESLNCNRSVILTLQGGYDSTYSSIVGDTVLNGTLTITDGTVIADGISVQ